MRAIKKLVHVCFITTAALGLGACARDRVIIVRDENRAEAAFDSAFDAVKSGAKATARAGEYVVERTDDAVVHAWRGTKEVARDAQRGVSDAWITAKLKSRYVADDKIDATDIDVDTRDGIVTLFGTVKSASIASQAVRGALETNGVVEVRSLLNYPAGLPIEQKYKRDY